MASIVISQQDLNIADTFLTAYLKDKITDADFSEGSVLRDFVVKAIAYIFAYLERERKITRDRQSLLSLASLPAGESIDEAVDALLSNWFLTRKTGSPAVLTATLHFSQAVDVELRPGTRFYRTPSTIFTPNLLSTQVIPSSELRPNVNADGSITDYSVTVSLVASENGTLGNVVPGKFSSADPFNSYFLYAENLTKGEGGKNIETSAELLERAPTAISVRNLINLRSIDTVLRDTFTVDAVRVIGYEEPEMIRDLSVESVSHLRMHVGGYVDIYVALPRTEVVETLTIGGLFPRPDGVANVLRDGTQNFITSGVQPGHVLRINTGLPTAPREYIITAVAETALEVQLRAPFDKATDELATFVDYTVGVYAPAFDNILGLGVPIATGETSRQLVNVGHVVLTGRPHYKIVSVEVINPDTTITILNPRVNGTPGLNEYQVFVRVPANAQSAFSVTELIMNEAHEGKSVRIRYETLVGYDDIQNYVRDRFERVVIANPLAKGFHPIYISMNLSFKLKSGATSVVDVADVSEVVADYINAFSPLEIVERSGIEAAIRAAFPDIGSILSPVQLLYTLLAPDGQVYQFQTDDIVTIFPKYLSNAARLTNGTDLRVPILNAALDPTVDANNETLFAAANVELSDQLSALGVSDRTVRYFANASDIVVTQVY